MAVRCSWARGTQGGHRLLQPLGGSGEVPGQQDTPTGDRSFLRPCPTSPAPQIFPCIPQMFPAPPDIPCLPSNFLTPPPGPVTAPKAHETTKSPLTHGPVSCRGLEAPHSPPTLVGSNSVSWLETPLLPVPAMGLTSMCQGGPYSLHPFNPVPLAWGPSLVCLRQWDPPAVAGKGVQEGEEGGSPEIQAVCSWGEPASSPMQCSVPCPRTLSIIFCFSMSSSGPTDTPSLPKPLQHCALRGQTRHNGELQDIPLHFNAQHVILPCCFVGWS